MFVCTCVLPCIHTHTSISKFNFHIPFNVGIHSFGSSCKPNSLNYSDSGSVYLALSLARSLSLSIYLSIYLPTYLSIYVSNYLYYLFFFNSWQYFSYYYLFIFMYRSFQYGSFYLLTTYLSLTCLLSSRFCVSQSDKSEIGKENLELRLPLWLKL